ncbi:DUF4013 domain-containing protein [Nanoarchaeota archaeon]
MDLETAIKKPFSDFSKLVIGLLLSILPIVRWLAAGYILESSGVKTNSSPYMPDWKNWGNLFVKGFVYVLISFIYIIPAILILFIGASSAISAMAGVYIQNNVPGAGESVAAGSEDAVALASVMENNWIEAVPAIIEAAPAVIIAIIIGILAWYLLPIAVLNYIKTDTFSAAFRFKEIFKKAFTGQYFLVWLVILIISIVAGMILGLIPFIGGAIHYFLIGIFSFHLFGEVYLKLQ